MFHIYDNLIVDAMSLFFEATKLFVALFVSDNKYTVSLQVWNFFVYVLSFLQINDSNIRQLFHRRNEFVRWSNKVVCCKVCRGQYTIVLLFVYVLPFLKRNFSYIWDIFRQLNEFVCCSNEFNSYIYDYLCDLIFDAVFQTWLKAFSFDVHPCMKSVLVFMVPGFPHI